jgi:hypothetical protein
VCCCKQLFGCWPFLFLALTLALAGLILTLPFLPLAVFFHFQTRPPLDQDDQHFDGAAAAAAAGVPQAHEPRPDPLQQPELAAEQEGLLDPHAAAEAEEEAEAAAGGRGRTIFGEQGLLNGELEDLVAVLDGFDTGDDFDDDDNDHDSNGGDGADGGSGGGSGSGGAPSASASDFEVDVEAQLKVLAGGGEDVPPAPVPEPVAEPEPATAVDVTEDEASAHTADLEAQLDDLQPIRLDLEPSGVPAESPAAPSAAVTPADAAADDDEEDDDHLDARPPESAETAELEPPEPPEARVDEAVVRP